MTDCTIHPQHDHQHGPGCGHTVIQHEHHRDYLHEGHLHHPHVVDGQIVHYDEHRIAVSADNPDGCLATTTGCAGHRHGADCGHEAIPHGDHVDYLVAGRLHHPHGDHCDDHGPVEVLVG